VVGEAGAALCPDCLGHGKAPRGELLEWRLRDLEQAHRGHPGTCEGDIRWLAFELRRHRSALVEVLTRCQDGEGTLAEQLRGLANEALGLYPMKREGD
jgi:hypothetical protein